MCNACGINHHDDDDINYDEVDDNPTEQETKA